MKKSTYIPLSEVRDVEETNGTIPVFERIIMIDGELHGELIGHCDRWGNRIKTNEVESRPEKYQ